MKKVILLQILILMVAALLSACSNGSSNNDVSSAQTATVLAYFPADSLEQENYMEAVVDTTTGVEAKMGIVNYYTDNIFYSINDKNTKAYIMTGAGNIIHDETTNSDAKYYLIKDFTKNYQYKVTNNKLEILNQDTAKVSCYTGTSPVNIDAADKSKCEDMGDVEVISDFFVKGIKENKTDKYVAMFLIPGNGSIIGLGGTEYIDLINAEKFGQIFEKIREKLGNPDFKFDTIIMISSLMGNAEFMHTVKDYADYYIGSEANEYQSTFNLYEYFQEAGKGYDSINAGNALLSSYKAKVDEYNLPLDLNMIDLSKIDLLSNALDNMSKVMLENYNKSTTDSKKTINNFFLSAYNSLNYDNGQVDIYTLLDRLGHTTDYYTDDYTASKNEIQAAIKEAVVNKVSTGIYQDGQGISINVFPDAYLDNYAYSLGNISFAPEYLSFIKKISQEIMNDKNSSVPEITASYNNGLEYTVKTPTAISSAQVEVGSFEVDNPENNRVGTLANVVIPEQEYDENTGLFTYKFNFGDPAKSLIFTINGHPVRVQSISGYKANDNISYYKTLDTYCSINNENVESNLIIKYDKSTSTAEIIQMNIYNILYNNIYLTTCDKFIIAPYSEQVDYAETTENTTENQPGEDEYIPDYEIPIDKTAEKGGLEAYAVEYNIYEVEPQYRLSFNTVENLGYYEQVSSPWQTLTEIQGSAAQQ